jgi:hypothetical protein
MIAIALSMLDAYAVDPYPTLQDLARTVYPEQALKVRGRSIRYKAYIRHPNDIPEDYLRESVRLASEISLDVIEGDPDLRPQCDRDAFVNLYEVSFDELNVKGYIVDAGQIGFGSIWGYYDPRGSRAGTDAISVANHTYGTTHVIFAHEVAHYWYDRLCSAANARSGTSEEFAKRIEEIYTKTLNGR